MPLLRPDQGSFERSYGADGPDTDQPGILRLVATLNLHRQPEHLQKQHSYQDDQVAITAEDGFHNSVSSFRFRVSRTPQDHVRSIELARKLET